MENNVTINVGVKEVGGSVKSIKQELREAQASAVQMARTFGENSTEATKAAQKVAKLRDEIEDVGLKIKGLNPDKFQRIATLGQGVAQGFVAAQGAMAMFGGQSQELEKTMVKLQGAIAMSQGLQGLKDLQLQFGGLGKEIRETVIKSFTTLKGAIASTGIGLLVIAVGALITNWKEFSTYIEKTFPSFKVVTDFFKNFRQIASGTLASVVEGFKVVGEVVGDIFTGQFSKAIDDASNFGTRISEAYNKAFEEKDRELKIEAGLKARKLQIELMEAQGKDVAQLQLKLLQDELSLLEKGSDEYNTKLVEIERKRTEIIKKANEEKLNLHKQYIKDSLAEFNKLADARTLKVNEEIKQEIKLLDRKKELTDDEKKYKAELSAQILKNNEIISTTTQAQGEIDKNKAIQQEKEKRDAGFELAKAGMEAVQTLSDMVFADKLSKVKKGSIEEEKILRKQFELNKAMQIGTAVINGLQSILAITSVPDFTMGVASAMRIASQVVLTSATIAKIASTKFNAPAPTSSDLPAPPSQSNLSSVVNQQRNVSGTSTGATGQNQVVKVIVTETDITRSQGRVNDIRRRALIH